MNENIEEQQVGGSSWVPPPEFTENETAPMDLDVTAQENNGGTESLVPIMNQINSKKWKERNEGYQRLIELFQGAEASDPLFSEYAPSLKAMVSESNVVAHSSALEAVSLHASKISLPLENIEEICSKVVLAFKNNKAKVAAISVLHSYIGKGYGECVYYALEQGFKNKVWKIVDACIDCLKEAIFLFGLDFFPFPSLLTQIYTLLAHKTREIRENAMNLLVEIYSWKGKFVIESLDQTKLRPGQLPEIKTKCEDVTVGQATATRFVESITSASNSTSSAAAPSPVVSSSKVKLSKILSKTFFQECKSKGWKDNVGALKALEKSLKAVEELESDSVTDDVIEQCISYTSEGTNLSVTTSSLTLLESLLQKYPDFQFRDLNGSLTSLLNLFKLKKSTIIKALDTLLDSVFVKVLKKSFSECEHSICHVLVEKMPKIPADTISWMIQSLKSVSPGSKKFPLSSGLCKALFASLSHSNGDVRKNSLDCLQAAFRISHSDKSFNSLLNGLFENDKKKFEFITQDSPPAQESTEMESEPILTPQERSKPAKKFIPIMEKSLPAEEKLSPVVSEKKPVAQEQPSEFPQKPQVPSNKNAQKESSSQTELVPLQLKSLEHLGEDQCIDKLSAHFADSSAFSGLSSDLWKDRLESLDSLQDICQSLDQDTCTSIYPHMMSLLNRKFSWKDANFKVCSSLYSLATLITKKSTHNSLVCCKMTFPEVLNKLGDAKVKSHALGYLNALCAAVGPQTIVNMSFENSPGKVKSPKALAEWNLWIAETIERFGTAQMCIEETIGHLGSRITHGNKNVRESCISIYQSIAKHGNKDEFLHLMVNDKINTFLKNSIQSALENIEKSETYYERVRNRKYIYSQTSETLEESSSSGSTWTSKLSRKPVKTVVDVSSVLHPSLLKDLNHAEWQKRQTALNDIQQIVETAPGLFEVTPKIVNLLKELGNRLKTDSKKSLTVLYLKVLQEIPRHLFVPSPDHNSTEKHVNPGKFVIPSICHSLGDMKRVISAQAESTLKEWANIGSYPLLCKYFSKAITMSTSREGLFKVLKESYQRNSQLHDNSFIKAIIVCLEDKKSSVRELALKLLERIVKDYGSGCLLSVFSGLDNATKERLKGMNAFSELLDYPTSGRMDESHETGGPIHELHKLSRVKHVSAPAATKESPPPQKQKSQEHVTTPSFETCQEHFPKTSFQTPKPKEKPIPPQNQQISQKPVPKAKPAQTPQQIFQTPQKFVNPLHAKQQRISKCMAMYQKDPSLFQAPSTRSLCESLCKGLISTVDGDLYYDMFSNNSGELRSSIQGVQSLLSAKQKSLLNISDLLIYWGIYLFSYKGEPFAEAVLSLFCEYSAYMQHFSYNLEEIEKVSIISLYALYGVEYSCSEGFMSLLKPLTNSKHLLPILMNGLTNKLSSPKQIAKLLEQIDTLCKSIQMKSFPSMETLIEIIYHTKLRNEDGCIHTLQCVRENLGNELFSKVCQDVHLKDDIYALLEISHTPVKELAKPHHTIDEDFETKFIGELPLRRKIPPASPPKSKTALRVSVPSESAFHRNTPSVEIDLHHLSLSSDAQQREEAMWRIVERANDPACRQEFIQKHNPNDLIEILENIIAKTNTQKILRYSCLVLSPLFKESTWTAKVSSDSFKAVLSMCITAGISAECSQDNKKHIEVILSSCIDCIPKSQSLILLLELLLSSEGPEYIEVVQRCVDKIVKSFAQDFDLLLVLKGIDNLMNTPSSSSKFNSLQQLVMYLQNHNTLFKETAQRLDPNEYVNILRFIKPSTEEPGNVKFEETIPSRRGRRKIALICLIAIVCALFAIAGLQGGEDQGDLEPQQLLSSAGLEPQQLISSVDLEVVDDTPPPSTDESGSDIVTAALVAFLTAAVGMLLG